MEFETLNIFKEVVRNYTVYHGRDIKCLKNDKQRSRVICKDEWCKSMMHNVCTFYSNDYFYVPMMLSLCVCKCLLSETLMIVSVYCQGPN